ncbi:MAG: hypothetical protein ABIH78_00185 [Candidatus Peregrinibacteria bacterium]
MADPITQITGTTATGGVSAGGVVVDKNKSAEQYMKEAEAKYIVPRLVREKFPDLVKLIYETESMNAEEREYWLQIMPIMTEEQIVKFRNILVNEKEQLSRLDSEYESEVSKMGAKAVKEIDESRLKEKIQEIRKEETESNKTEESEEEALLQNLKNL